MNCISTAVLYVARKKENSLLLISIMSLIFFGELIGLFLYQTSKRGMEDAYRYNGPAILLDASEQELVEADYDRIRKIDHVTGIGSWKEILITPENATNVKDHIGCDFYGNTPDERGVKDDMVLLAHMDISQYQMFRWEKNVSLISGSFPKNGILIERRFAEQNGLSVGDTVTFTVREDGRTIVLFVDGIYQVDSEFEILDTNTEGASVFIHSPYNTVYMDYYSALQTIGFDDVASTGGEIYVDSIDSLESVAEQLRDIFTGRVVLYDNTTYYLQNECQIVTLMMRISGLICMMIFTMGQIIMLISVSLMSEQYRHDIAVFLMLGEKKRRCVFRFVVIMGFYILIAATLAVGIYLVGGRGLEVLTENASIQFVEQHRNVGIGGYRNSGIGLGFRMTVDAFAIFNPFVYKTMAGVILITWIIASILPSYIVNRLHPRNIMNH